MKYNILSCLLVCLSFDLLLAECPEPNVIAPCLCKNTTGVTTFVCKDTPEDFNITTIFLNGSKYIKDKNDLDVFRLENSHIDKLQYHALTSIHFNRFEFINCSKLTFVDQGALGDQTPIIKELVFESTPVTNSAEDYNIFDAINRLSSIEHLDLSGTQLIDVPEDAFTPALAWYDLQIRHLLFCKPLEKCRSIRSVGKKAFYYMNRLEYIDLSRHLIQSIGDYAFAIHNVSESGPELEIILNENLLNGESFGDNSFQFIGRPTRLSLADNKNLTFLKQQVFQSFLEDNGLNQLNITNCPIVWSSVQMDWFRNLSQELKSRIHF